MRTHHNAVDLSLARKRQDLVRGQSRTHHHLAAKADSGGKTLALLQAGMVALQAMDIVSTRQALSRPGAYEANAAFGSGNPSMAATIALKAGATASIILLTSRIAKTNHAAAIVTMVALDSAYATISAHNFAVAHGR